VGKADYSGGRSCRRESQIAALESILATEIHNRIQPAIAGATCCCGRRQIDFLPATIPELRRRDRQTDRALARNGRLPDTMPSFQPLRTGTCLSIVPRNLKAAPPRPAGAEHEQMAMCGLREPSIAPAAPSRRSPCACRVGAGRPTTLHAGRKRDHRKILSNKLGQRRHESR